MKTTDNYQGKQFNNENKKVTDLKDRCVYLEQQVEELSAKVKYYEELFRINQSKRFGSSSEKTTDEQLSFFNEAEKNSRDNLAQPDLEEVTYKRRKSRGLNKKSMEDLPVEVIEYDLSEEDKECPECSGNLHKMSEEIRRELVIIPAQVKVIKHVRSVYACRNCERENIKTPIITAPMPKPVLPGSFVSPSLMAFIMNRKYAEAIPLYRQEQQFINFGINLSRQNLANWIINGANKWLKILYDRMHEYLIKESFLHADETTLQVLDEDGKDANSKSYMWLYATGRFGPQIVLYDYQKSRAKKHPKAFLSGFKGYLQTDGYPGYNDVENVTLIGCFAHARRGFTDALKAIKDKTSISSSVAKEGLKFCNDLFAIEKTLSGLTPKERYKRRLKESKPILEAFLSWLKEKKELVLPKSALGKAINYSLNQWSKLEAFLLDGQIEISNNRAERAIKPFVIGRKNFLFCKSPKGATASSIIYSVVETAKANNLSPFHYLNYLFEQLPNIDINDIKQLDQLLPWSDNIPDICRVGPNK
ncbi:IS66 family transposase [Paramaledivibacter caminithermalis]|uniref:Transposase n=2 Tax=Paramaledivibacter caminithermalis (strain DSM 15212 / CIP 107654 / DViRD3) TaxID=1121301 RepID=A0A1M6U4A7_PARC5|nr:IS66 family transposase [Paramaledivibacter caminithermalis]SHK64017.1 Transposase [Paramaledivibacter caminithermalis DSM 15212]